MNDFKPARRNPIVQAIARMLLPIAARKEQLELELTPDFLARFRRVHNAHAMIAMNHADRYDPMVAFWLSKICNEEFYYLAARELFDDPFNGFVLQSCGTYSVIRGTEAESASAEYTISIIAEEHKKLVMFPEGDVTGRDNEILPLKKDGVANILKAQQRIADRDASKSVNLLPVAIYYQYNDSDEPLLSALEKLEEALAITKQDRDREVRTLAVVESTINRAATEYGISLDDGEIRRRLLNLCAEMTKSIAHRTGIAVDGAEPESVLLYNARAKVRRQIDMSGATAETRFATQQLDRIQQLLILASTMHQPFSRESCWRIIDRVEQEVFGKPSVKGKRKARIAVAEAIEVKQFQSRFNSAPEQAVDALESSLRQSMQDALDKAKAFESTFSPPPYRFSPTHQNRP